MAIFPLLPRLLLLLALSLPALSGSAIAQVDFQNIDLANKVLRFDAILRDQSGQADISQPIAQLRKNIAAAKNRNDTSRALELMSALLLREPGNFQDWLSYARLASTYGTDDYSERYQWLERAQTAAYAGFQRAIKSADKAQALAVLGEVQMRADQFQQAIQAYKASLALRSNPAVQSIYDELRERYGFRILSNKIDSDGITPRACFQFSEPVAKGIDFSPYIVVTGIDNPTVTAKDLQICVDGLKHGERYNIVIRQGLPAASDEALLRNSDYEIYVRDRAPSVRFTGRNYVLPSTGQEGIPVISVNTDAVEIEIFRIGDRNLLETIRNGSFLDQLNRWVVDVIKEERGEKIWNGTLETRSPLNKDEITTFPVHEAAGTTFQPGVYLLTARPASGLPAAEDYGQRATQWFVVSDIGLTTLTNEGGLRVLTRSLASAQPIGNVNLQLIARNNEVLAKARSNANGEAFFDPGLIRGQGGTAPGILVASTELGDYNFIDLAQAPFDLTDRGVSGRLAPGPLDGEVFTERGVYRTGETVQVTMLLRDSSGKAVDNLPVTLIARRPDGVEYRRTVVADQGLGGRSWSLPLLPGAAHGTWRIQAYIDPKASPIGGASFLVEDYIPERIELNLNPKSPAIPSGHAADIDIDARYLYGAPASGLNITGEVILQQAEATAIPGLEGFHVGFDDEYFENVMLAIDDKATDKQGKAHLKVSIPDVAAQRPIQARITLRVGETGGRAVERSLTMPILPSESVIGLRPLFKNLTEGAQAQFEIAMASPHGERKSGTLHWMLLKVEEDFQWFNQGGQWSFENVSRTRRVLDGTLDVSAAELGMLSVPVEWGRYRLEIMSPDGLAQPTSISFVSGYSGDATARIPDRLDLTLDKSEYSAGENLIVKLNPQFSGKATVFVVSNRIHEERAVDVTVGGTSLTIPVKAEWGPGAYVVAVAHRPLDEKAKRQPGRTLGLAWFSVDRASRTLKVDLGGEKTIKPRSSLHVPIKLSGLKAGEEAYVVAAAVDVGILNLTRHEPENPGEYFFGKRQLGTDIRDIYGFLIDGMQGARGAIRSGGDGGALQLEGSPPSQEPLALYSGLIKVDADGNAPVEFDIPSFNGTVRVMVVAWSKEKVGSSSTDIIVRDPVVLSTSSPRFLNVGDDTNLSFRVDNVAGIAGTYKVSLDINGPVKADIKDLEQAIQLDQGSHKNFSIPLTATGVGQATLRAFISGPGFDSEQILRLDVGPGTRPLVRRTVHKVMPGQSISVSKDLLKDILPGTGVLSLSVTPRLALDVPALLQALENYPYGCTEQIVSRAMPLLYTNTPAALDALPSDVDINKSVNEAISRVLSRQSATGSFGLWSVGGDDLWLDAYVTDFLTRAREHEFEVSQIAFTQALDRLRNAVVNSDSFPDEEARALAYASYVLARNGRPIIGDLRYFADARLNSFGSSFAQAQIGAALALLGDRTRAERVVKQAVATLQAERDRENGRNDYGSLLRDAAGLLALVEETGAGRSHIDAIAEVLERARTARHYTSTQENAWMLLAAAGLAESAKNQSLMVNGRAHTGVLFQTVSEDEIASSPIAITNKGQEPVSLVITLAGNPTSPEAELARGYDIERSYYTIDGKEANPAHVRQNERLVTVLKITEREATQGKVLLVDFLPAGFEIDSPRLIDSADLESFPWLTRDVEPSHVEYRDDRFVAAFDRASDQSALFSVAYVIRAVSPGKYAHPPAVVEDMYRPERFGRTGYNTVEITGAVKTP